MINKSDFMIITSHVNNPNSRRNFYSAVDALVELLISDTGKKFITDVSILISTQNLNDLSNEINRLSFSRNDLDNSEKIIWDSIMNQFKQLYRSNHLPNLRGAILELFGYKLLCERMGCKMGCDYSCDHFALDCYLQVSNGASTWVSAKTIDIFGFLPFKEKGECYECKLSVSIEEEHIENLNSIHSETNGNMLTGILCFASIHTLKESVLDIIERSNSQLSHNTIIFYGHENIKDL
jgi:hypothetical protein